MKFLTINVGQGEDCIQISIQDFTDGSNQFGIIGGIYSNMITTLIPKVKGQSHSINMIIVQCIHNMMCQLMDATVFKFGIAL